MLIKSDYPEEYIYVKYFPLKRRDAIFCVSTGNGLLNDAILSGNYIG